MEKVSIIVPIYNSSKTIGKCLESILAQTYKNIEIIIVDDGSTDDSYAICSSFASLSPKIILVSQKNSGPSMARNIGLSKSSGTYIQFVDSDDTIEPYMTEELVHEIGENCQLAICRYKTVINGEVVKKKELNMTAFRGILNVREFSKELHYFIGSEILNSPCNKLYLSTIIKANGLVFDTSISIGEDLVFNLDYIKYTKLINILDSELYIYDVTSNNSLTRRRQPIGMLQNQTFLLNRLLSFLSNYESLNDANKNQIGIQFINIALACIDNCYKQESFIVSEKLKCINEVKNSSIVDWIRQNVEPQGQPIMQRLRLSVLLCKCNIIVSIVFFLRDKIKRLNAFLRKCYNKANRKPTGRILS